MRYLIVHFGDFESLAYQSSIILSIKNESSKHEIDLLLPKSLDGIELVNSISETHILPDAYLKKRAFYKSLADKYDYIINAHRSDYDESLDVIKRIKCKNKIGYNKRRKHYNLELSKEKKEHLIDHYLKVCDCLNIKKIRRIELNLSSKDEAIDSKLLILCEAWDSQRVQKLIQMPMFRMFSCSIVSSESLVFKSWKTVSTLKRLDEGSLSSYSLIISDDVKLKIFCDALNIPMIFLTSKDKELRERFPIFKKSYAVTPRIANAYVSEIEVDAVVQALNLIIHDLE